jgi:broad specificity phosphatase PhoE
MAFPETTLKSLNLAKKSKRVVLLMRHSNRFPINNDNEIYTAGLTPEGVQNAELYGAELAKYWNIRVLGSNFVGRCKDTASAIGRGAGLPLKVKELEEIKFDFVGNIWDNRVSRIHKELPHEIQIMLLTLLNSLEKVEGLGVYVTHDSVLACVMVYLLGLKVEVDGENWPQFLEGLVIWKENEQLCCAWRGHLYTPAFFQKQDRLALTHPVLVTC